MQRKCLFFLRANAFICPLGWAYLMQCMACKIVIALHEEGFLFLQLWSFVCFLVFPRSSLDVGMGKAKSTTVG